MNTYELTHYTHHCDWSTGRSKETKYVETVQAETPGKAKAELWRQWSECGYEFFEFVKSITKCRLLHKFRIEDLFEDKRQFDRMKKARNIEFAYQGMKIEVDGKIGKIVGSNSSMNLDVVFDGQFHTSNCHPWWKTKYFSKDDEVITEYGE